MGAGLAEQVKRQGGLAGAVGVLAERVGDFLQRLRGILLAELFRFQADGGQGVAGAFRFFVGPGKRLG